MNNVEEIAKLNDEFRANPSLGTLILTEGIRSNTHDDIATIINKVRNFNDFDEGNNPYGEKDFGAFDFKGKKIFWKIDYYDNKRKTNNKSKKREVRSKEILSLTSGNIFINVN